MHTLRRIVTLSAADLKIVMEAAAVVIAMRLCLWIVPSRALLRFVARRVASAPHSDVVCNPAIMRIGWGVRAVSRWVPAASCLTQALSAQLLLARRGYASELGIGVIRGAQQTLIAHAWVEIGGTILVGGSEISQYQRMPNIAPRL